MSQKFILTFLTDTFLTDKKSDLLPKPLRIITLKTKLRKVEISWDKSQRVAINLKKSMVVVTRCPSYLPHTLREPADVQWILPTFFSNFILMMRGKCGSRKRLSDSVEITQDVSQWYRECQSCRKKSPLQLPRSAEHDLCGRLQFIHTMSTARKLLLESDWSGLKRATCALVKINYLEEFSNSSPTLQPPLKSRWRVQNTSPFKFSWSFPWSIWK